jgi:hypothetical protein
MLAQAEGEANGIDKLCLL